MQNRPDFSKYLVHFTKGRKPDSKAMDNPALQFKGHSAKERLLGILRSKKIIASRLTTGNDSDAVCLTECVWSSLLIHAKRYSCYGIGFTKEFVYKQGGNPVFYANSIIFNDLIGSKHKAFMALYDPFAPHPIDFSHEREWRNPNELTFNYPDIAFVIIKSQYDIPDFQPFIKSIGIDKVIIMDEYKKTEKFWPTHKVYTQE